MPNQELSALTTSQLAILLKHSSKQRDELDKVLVEKLKNVEEMERQLQNSRKELQLHHQRETIRREMETSIIDLDQQIAALETQKAEKKEECEARLRDIDTVCADCTNSRTDLPRRD
jgi:uncharacterized protein (DUF342 family)